MYPKMFEHKTLNTLYANIAIKTFVAMRILLAEDDVFLVYVEFLK